MNVSLRKLRKVHNQSSSQLVSSSVVSVSFPFSSVINHQSSVISHQSSIIRIDNYQQQITSVRMSDPTVVLLCLWVVCCAAKPMIWSAFSPCRLWRSLSLLEKTTSGGFVVKLEGCVCSLFLVHCVFPNTRHVLRSRTTRYPWT